ncbi:MAG: class I SAM-dependent methyltransferase [Patescibacteria group bacterium]
MHIDKTKFEDKNKKMFSWVARYYDNGLFRKYYFEKIYDRVLLEAEGTMKNYFGRPIKLLDVACGTGEIINRLSRKFPESEFLGADFSEEMLAKARAKPPTATKIRFLAAEVTALPFANETFDLIICTEAFHHFSRPDDALREIRRLLKPDGMFLLIDLAFNIRVIKTLIGPFFHWLENAYAYYSKPELEKKLELNGFVIQKSYTYYFNNYFFTAKK